MARYLSMDIETVIKILECDWSIGHDGLCSDWSIPDAEEDIVKRK